MHDHMKNGVDCNSRRLATAPRSIDYPTNVTTHNRNDILSKLDSAKCNKITIGKLYHTLLKFDLRVKQYWNPP